MQAIEPDILAALARPEAHPGDPGASRGVSFVQTHISYVFLTPERVYKLRKAVALSFLDFSSRSARNADCMRELILNRRLAPDVYLGVAPIRRGPQGWWVGGVAQALAATGTDGEVPEHCVVMRRLPEGRDALSLLERARLVPEQLDALARRLAGFHADHGLGVPAPYSAQAWLERVRRPVRDCFVALRDVPLAELDAARIERVELLEQCRFAGAASELETRRRAGRAVDGHGDVHLQHVWFEQDAAEPLLIDCIEFNDDLRRIDTASEVAFLAMDLAYRRRGDLAERFLRSYAAAADDFQLYAVVDYYAAYRALVRAKVAALAACDERIAVAQREGALGSASRHLDLAATFLGERRAGALVLTCGRVGSGKSTVAGVLADAAGAVVISSDRTRKHLAGLAPTARGAAGTGKGLYTKAWSDRVYAGLLERAGPVLASGRVAILDATFPRADRRRSAQAWARRRGVPCWLLEVRCGEPVALERLARRQAHGGDPSDAGPELYAWGARSFEPPVEWPSDTHLVVATDDPGWRDQVSGLARRLR